MRADDLDLRPMRVVIGAIPALDDIVGRERERLACLRSLDGHGCRLTGDRRYGKTSLARLARLVEADCAAAGRVAVRVSAERQAFLDFVAALAQVLSEADSVIKREVDRWRVSVDTGLVSAERTPATRSLDALVRRAVESSGNRQLILIIDEVPVLAQAMNEVEPGSGAAFLHLLRRLRQDFSGRLAMVLSGSIGFHHVTRDALGVVNDVEPIAVGPLQADDAAYLARCLLLGETVPTTDQAAVGDSVAETAENVPYYVQHLVKSARDLAAHRAEPIAPSDIPRLVDDALTNPDDPWNLRHYRDRIPAYYGDDRVALVSAIIDAVADAAAPLDIDALQRHIASVALDQRPGRQELTELVELLEADHYFRRRGSASVFASELVRRAWNAGRR